MAASIALSPSTTTWFEIGALVLLLFVLVALGAHALTRNYVATSKYGGANSRSVYRGTAIFLSILVLWAVGLGLFPSAHAGLFLVAASALLIALAIAFAVVRKRLHRHHGNQQPPKSE